MLKTLMLFILILFPSAIALSLTVEEYFALAPELLGALANITLMIYTVCAGSFVAFYIFGWNANWGIRVIGSLFFLAILDGVFSHGDRALHTLFEAQYRYFVENDLCSTEEPFKQIYEGFKSLACSPDFQGMSKQQRADLLFNIYKDFDLIGRGFTQANVTGGLGLSIFRFGGWSPLLLFSVVVSLGIWLICPSKQFCIRKGWIND
jgi:hypothetical protein